MSILDITASGPPTHPRRRSQSVHCLELPIQVTLVGKAALVRHTGEPVDWCAGPVHLSGGTARQQVLEQRASGGCGATGTGLPGRDGKERSLPGELNAGCGLNVPPGPVAARTAARGGGHVRRALRRLAPAGSTASFPLTGLVESYARKCAIDRAVGGPYAASPGSITSCRSRSPPCLAAISFLSRVHARSTFPA
jgi:hypothetical protein